MLSNPERSDFFGIARFSGMVLHGSAMLYLKKIRQPHSNIPSGRYFLISDYFSNY